jgi:glutamate-5-semialdehyde dehydrogenase
VAVDAAALCFKTSNAVILRGGKEALESNKALVDALQAGGARKGLPPHSIQLIGTTDHDAVRELVQLEGRVDLVIPRGGEKLIRAVTEQAYVPVIKHYKGVCHAFVDVSRRPCQGARHHRERQMQPPRRLQRPRKGARPRGSPPPSCRNWPSASCAKRVELRGDEAARAIVPAMVPAAARDWDEEYLDLILTVGVVPSLEAAIDHINRHGSHHSDVILSEDEKAQKRFTEQVDSACVYANASTRFTDGGEFGMGAEIGISTDKLHARGPMALEELTTYKYVIQGNGQIRV